MNAALFRRLPGPVATLVVADAVVAFLAFHGAVALRFAFDLDSSQEAFGPLFPRALVFAACILLGMLSMGLYRPRQRPTGEEGAVRVALAVVIGGVGNLILFYLIPSLEIWRGPMALAMVITCITVILVRLGLIRILDRNPVKRRVLVIGAGDTAGRIRRLRRRADRRRFEVLAFVAMSEEEKTRARALDIEPVITVTEAQALERIDELVVALDDRRGILPLEFLLARKQRGIPVTDVVDFLERETERLDLDILKPSWLLYENSSQTDLLYRWLKRLFDIVFSIALLVVASPLIVLTVVAIRLEDGWRAPLFYRQQRVGRNGRIFQLLKFRSMRVDAERGTGPRFAVADDDRVTRTGRAIRRFRIDELPQLLNVIVGDMSVVGPRPERPAFVEQLARREPLYFYRHGVRPGLTGWAQLNFPYGASLDDGREKLTFDLYYIKNANIVMDLLILLQTLEVVVWGRGTSMAGVVREPARGRDPEDGKPELALLEARGKDAA